MGTNAPRDESERVWLDPIPPELREKAVTALDRGDADGFLAMAPNDYGLDLVFYNTPRLKNKGIYESALIRAFTSTRVNNHGVSMAYLESMFQIASRARLRAASDPLPGAGPFEIYRGVAGNGRARRVRGMSWTASFEKAKWFATRFNFANPAVFRTIVHESDVFAYTNLRNEREFLVQLPARNKPVRVWSLSSSRTSATAVVKL